MLCTSHACLCGSVHRSFCVHVHVPVCVDVRVNMCACVCCTCMLVWDCAQVLLCSCLCACICGCQSTLGVAFHHCFPPPFFLLEIYYFPYLLILLFILKNSHFFLIFKIKIYCLKISYVPIICSGQIHSTPPSSVFPFPPPLFLSPGFMSSLYNPLSPLEHGHPIRDCIYQKQSVANSS